MSARGSETSVNKIGAANEAFTQEGVNRSSPSVAIEMFSATEHSADAEPDAVEEENSSQEFPEYLQEEFEDLDAAELDGCAARVDECMSGFRKAVAKSATLAKYTLLLALLIGYAVYFAFSMVCSFGDEASLRLLVLTCLAVFLAMVHLTNRFLGARASAAVQPLLRRWQQFADGHATAVKIVGTCCFFVYFGSIVGVVASQNPSNLMSLVGVVFIVFIALLTSAHPTRVNWRPVMGGLTLQITFAALMLRTQPGYAAFSFLGDRVAEFIQHVDAGAKFVFGEKFTDHYFAFSVLSVIVFFSSFVALMFHLGVLQAIIEKLGWVMQNLMGTTSGESLVAAANIFVGQTEAPLMIRPFVGRMTNSELHAVLTCGYATIAGGVLAAYIGLGVPARHLLSASVMVAPGALALSKIAYPETKKSMTDSENIKKIKMANYHNAIDAIGTGAINAVSLVAAIAVNLIAFITTLTFLNSTLTWLGRRACLPVDLTFEMICGYALWPLAYLVGIQTVDCQRVAELIGIKFFINEFVAYEKLNTYLKNFAIFRTMNDTEYQWIGQDLFFPQSNVTLHGGLLFHDRSLTISTYALCGFANISSIGIQLGMLSILMPKRKSEAVPLVLRAVIIGTLANLMTASVAGIFYEPPSA